ncbi:hypothetical protein ACOSQ3_007582 [Xanthoceras sorbifolium]
MSFFIYLLYAKIISFNFNYLLQCEAFFGHRGHRISDVANAMLDLDKLGFEFVSCGRNTDIYIYLHHGALAGFVSELQSFANRQSNRPTYNFPWPPQMILSL